MAVPENKTSRTTIVICSANRPEMLEATISSVIESQTVSPHAVLLGVFNPNHVNETTRVLPRVKVFLSPQPGTSVQRNVAGRQVETEFTLFVDDDVELAPNYIESMQKLADRRPEMVAATATVIADGARGETGIQRAEAVRMTTGYQPTGEDSLQEEAYGCNVFVRTPVMQRLCFDENLAYYGWLEDFDFATRLLHHGCIVLNRGTGMVHLGTPSGRVSGTRFGYAQVMNPVYLMRKNGRPNIFRLLIRYIGLPMLKNLVDELKGTKYIRSDRRGRLRGNLLAVRDILSGRIDPRYGTQIKG